MAQIIGTLKFTIYRLTTEHDFREVWENLGINNVPGKFV
jgi:hypothetical protein